MKITKRQLKRIIKEELKLVEGNLESSMYDRVAKEQGYLGDNSDLYVNLTDEQTVALDDLERAVNKCIAAGVTNGDMMDTVKSKMVS